MRIDAQMWWPNAVARQVESCHHGSSGGVDFDAMSFDVAAEAYDGFMGRYSRLLSGVR